AGDTAARRGGPDGPSGRLALSAGFAERAVRLVAAPGRTPGHRDRVGKHASARVAAERADSPARCRNVDTTHPGRADRRCRSAELVRHGACLSCAQEIVHGTYDGGAAHPREPVSFGGSHVVARGFRTRSSSCATIWPNARVASGPAGTIASPRQSGCKVHP